MRDRRRRHSACRPNGWLLEFVSAFEANDVIDHRDVEDLSDDDPNTTIGDKAHDVLLLKRSGLKPPRARSCDREKVEASLRQLFRHAVLQRPTRSAQMRHSRFLFGGKWPGRA